jgi:hypothetical protein
MNIDFRLGKYMEEKEDEKKKKKEEEEEEEGEEETKSAMQEMDRCMNKDILERRQRIE